MFYNILNWIKKKLGFGSVIVPSQKPKLEIPPSKTPINGGGTSRVILGTVENAIGNEIAMCAMAVEHLDKIICSQQFKDEVFKAKFTSTNGLSNQEIYEALTSGTIRINVSMFYGSYMQNHVWKTQGLDDGTGVVNANRYFINNAFDMASLMLHEFAHQKGFHHIVASEYTSIPYMMNSIFETIAEKLGIKK